MKIDKRKNIGFAAQRRPERQPRRHTPMMTTRAFSFRAQRRPEHQPRRHPVFIRQQVCDVPRSTKAGASTPATPTTARVEIRSTSPLNEGRSINPGDTSLRHNGTTGHAGAQRRPEHQPRRHTPMPKMRMATRSPLNEGRSINPGDTSGSLSGRGRSPSPLNEGRSINPGDTHLSQASPFFDFIAAQRRPEHQPRRHMPPPHTPARFSKRPLNEGRSINPGDTAKFCKRAVPGQPSLVHGRGSLDDDAFAAVSRDFGRYPVRMVRIKQSRLP